MTASQPQNRDDLNGRHDDDGAFGESEERFRLMVEAVRDYAIFMLDPSGVVMSWNAGAERIKGYRASEIIGQHFSRFYPPEDIAAGKPERELAIAIAEGRVEDEGWRVRKDGSHFWANVVITALYDSTGRLRGFGKVTRDLTERLQARLTSQALADSEATILRLRTMETQLTSLVEASASLISTLQLDAILPTVLDLARRLVAADAYAVWRFQAPANTWRLVASTGLSEDYQQESIENYGNSVPFDQPVLAEDVETVPMLAHRLAGYRREGIRAMLVIPLWIHGEPSGSITYYFRRPRRFAEVEIRLGTALANIAAGAIGSAELYEEQTRLRDAAEQARHRVAFLAEASRILAESLDYQTTLGSLARLIIPDLADWAAIDLADQNGDLQLVAVAHPDPEMVALGHEMRQRYPAQHDASRMTTQVLLSGQTTMVSEITDAMMEASAYDAEHLALIRRLGIRSILYIPVLIRGRAVGILTLAMAGSGRHYSQADIGMAEEIARRAGVAIDNARLYAEAQAAIRIREEFLSIASHELKTPVTGLQLQVQMLRRFARQGTLTDLPAERLNSMLERAERQTKQLAKLINDLLDLSRITAGRLELDLEDVDLADLTARVAELFSAELADSGSRLTLDAPTPVIGYWDRNRLEQIISNLLGNAIKYGEGRPITVSVGGNTDQATLVVRDEGIGIAADYLDRIFDRFERAVDAHNYGGFGLGLYIVRQIVEALGGTITVTSREGAGATFRATLPLAGPPLPGNTEA